MASRKSRLTPEHIGADGLALDSGSNNRRVVNVRFPADEHAFLMAHGGMTRNVRRAVHELMEREQGLAPVEVAMRTYIEIGALLVADVTSLQREYAAAETLQKRTYVRMEFDKLRARVAELTRYSKGD